MPVLNDHEIVHEIIDPFHRTKVHHTETQGNLRVGTLESVRLHNPETAAEIKSKNPHFLDIPIPVRITHSCMITMPKMPYETEWDRKHKKVEDASELNHGTTDSI